MRYTKTTQQTPELQYARQGDAGLDLYTGKQQVTLYQNQIEFVSSGISVELPDNHVGIVAIRSSLGARGITIANGIGVIDAGYRGEIGLLLLNHSFEPVILAPYSKVAQLIVMPVATVKPTLVTQLSETERGTGGFGSTDKPTVSSSKLRCICSEKYRGLRNTVVTTEEALNATRGYESVRQSSMLLSETTSNASRYRHERPAKGVRLA